MSVHNVLPGFLDVLKLFRVYEDAVGGFVRACELRDKRAAAGFVRVMWRLDCFLAEKKLEL